MEIKKVRITRGPGSVREFIGNVILAILLFPVVATLFGLFAVLVGG